MLYAVARRDLIGAAIALLGGGALTSALSNLELKRLIGLAAGRDTQKIINIAAPVEQAFSFWTNYEDFPKLMSNVREVKKTDERRSIGLLRGLPALLSNGMPWSPAWSRTN